MSRNRNFSFLGLLFAACVFVIPNFFGAPRPPSPLVRFTDVAQKAGIDVQMINGPGTKKYAFESTGSGVALIDYDGDGRLAAGCDFYCSARPATGVIEKR